MKILLVGDMHVTVEELGDSQALIDGILSLERMHDPDCVVFLGDQHHNHALVRVEVTDFWLRNLPRFQRPVTMLLGNHDRPNDASTTAHALQPYSKLATIVDKACVFGDVGLLPYYHDKAKMIEDVAQMKAQGVNKIVCHQTFNGSKYENGFYAPDGMDPADLDVPTIVSGHIHSTQTVYWDRGTVFYLGSPRWRTMSDANVPKMVAVWDTEKSGSMLVCDTQKWCSPISAAQVTLESDLDSVPFASHPKARFHLDAVATKAEMDSLVAKIRAKFPNSKVRPFVSDKGGSEARVTESEGVFNALRRFVGTYRPVYGTSSEVLQKMIAERLNVN